MYFSITFTDISSNTSYNTWERWHMVPTSRPYVEIPKVKTDYIDIPGADGSLDYTEALSGIHYNNSEGSWEFMVLNTQDGFLDYDWATIYHDILTTLHGKKMRIELESDPGHVYIGRLSVKWQTQSDRSTVTIDYNIDTGTPIPDNPNNTEET